MFTIFYSYWAGDGTNDETQFAIHKDEDLDDAIVYIEDELMGRVEYVFKGDLVPLDY